MFPTKSSIYSETIAFPYYFKIPPKSEVLLQFERNFSHFNLQIETCHSNSKWFASRKACLRVCVCVYTQYTHTQHSAHRKHWLRFQIGQYDEKLTPIG